MEDLGQAGLQVVPVFGTEFSRDLDRGTDKAMRFAGSRGGRTFGDSAGRSMVASISSHAKRAALITAGAFSAAAAGAVILGRSALEEARESQKVGALTAQTITNQGSAAATTARHIGRLSFALGKKAGIDDEIVQSGANVIARFTQIRNEVGKGNRVFDRAVAASTDMAAALAGGKGGDIDVASASQKVGRLLADPVKGMGMLARSGVVFTQQQKDMVKAMVESGDSLGAQTYLLDQIEQKFGGAAHAQRTLSDQVDFATGNIKEKLGNVLLPLVDDVEQAFLKKGMPVVRDWVAAFRDEGVPALKDFAGWVGDHGVPKAEAFYKKMRPLGEEVIPAIADGLGIARDALAGAAPYAANMVGAFNDAPDWVKKGTVFAGLAALAGKKLDLFGGGKSGGGLLGLVSKAKPIPVLVVNPGFGGAGGDVPIIGGRGPKGGRVPRGRGPRLPGKLGLLAALGLGVAGTATSGGQSGSNQDAASDILTGASLGSFFGPYGTALGAGYGALNDAYTSTPTKDLPVSKYERRFQASNPTYGFPQLEAGNNPFSAGIEKLQQQIHAVEVHKIQPTFDILGLVEANAKVTAFRSDASKPIHVGVVLDAISDAFGQAGDALDDFLGSSDSGSNRRGRGHRRQPAHSKGGVIVHIDKMVAQDYRDMQRQLQGRTQQANLGGRPT